MKKLLCPENLIMTSFFSIYIAIGRNFIVAPNMSKVQNVADTPKRPSEMQNFRTRRGALMPICRAKAFDAYISLYRMRDA